MDRFHQLLFTRLCEGVYKHYRYCLTHGAIFFHRQGSAPDHTSGTCNVIELWPYDTPEKAYYLCKVLQEGKE